MSEISSLSTGVFDIFLRFFKKNYSWENFVGVRDVNYGIATLTSIIVADGLLLLCVSCAFIVFYDFNAMGYATNALAYVIPVFAILCKVIIDRVWHIFHVKKMKESA